MHTFRFNPIFNTWVLLGTSYAASPQLLPEHFLDIGHKGRFVAANHPRQPFLLEPPSKLGVSGKDQLFADQPPVGEYELLLYKGKDPVFTWDYQEWDGWLTLIQQRMRQLHHNPYLHYVHIGLNTAVVDTVPGYQRVGDLIAASHPLSGMSTPLDAELAEKIKQKDTLFSLNQDKWGRLMVPLAPIREKELWYLPETPKPSFEQITKGEREGLAKVLAVILRELKTHYSHEEYAVTIHTDLVGGDQSTTWWLQIYRQESGVESPLAVKPLPEIFLHKLRQIL